MINDKKQWPGEVFRPVFHYIQSKHPKLTARRTAKIAKGVLAAREALNLSMSRNKREEISGVSLENYAGAEQRQRNPWLLREQAL